MSSRVDALLARFKTGQRRALQVQADARQEREDKLAKTEGGLRQGASGMAVAVVVGGVWIGQRLMLLLSSRRHTGTYGGPMKVTQCRCSREEWTGMRRAGRLCAPNQQTTGKAKSKPRPRKAGSAISGDASASVASGGGGAVADWKQRSRSGQAAVPLGVKLKAVVDFLRASGEPQRALALAAATGL